MLIIPAREIDFLLDNTIRKVQSLYSSLKIILVLDVIPKQVNYKNVEIIKSYSKNISSKRNKGVKIASTPYVAFLDSDAYPRSGWLENSIEFLEQNKNYTAVTGNQYNAPDDDFEQKCLRLVRFSPLFTQNQWLKIIDSNAKEQDCTEFMSSNVIIRREDYLNIGGMNEKIYLAEDNEFSSRLILKGYKIRFIPDASVYHRECKTYAFFRKIFCMGYYYSEMLWSYDIDWFKKSILMYIMPLLFSLFYIFLIFMSVINYISWYIVVYILAVVLLLLFILAVYMSLKLDKNNIIGIFCIFFYYILFCIVYVISSFVGIMKIPAKDVHSMYKHY